MVFIKETLVAALIVFLQVLLTFYDISNTYLADFDT